MVLAAWVKRRQFEKGLEQGLEKGVEKGRAEERKRANAKMRAWLKTPWKPNNKEDPSPSTNCPSLTKLSRKNADSLAIIPLMMLTILPGAWDYLRE